jgi:hypothetical protein
MLIRQISLEQSDGNDICNNFSLLLYSESYIIETCSNSSTPYISGNSSKTFNLTVCYNQNYCLRRKCEEYSINDFPDDKGCTVIGEFALCGKK